MSFSLLERYLDLASRRLHLWCLGDVGCCSISTSRRPHLWCLGEIGCCSISWRFLRGSSIEKTPSVVSGWDRLLLDFYVDVTSRRLHLWCLDETGRCSIFTWIQYWEVSICGILVKVAVARFLRGSSIEKSPSVVSWWDWLLLDHGSSTMAVA